MAESKQQRALVIELAEAKQELIAAVDTAIKKHKLPMYLVEPIMLDIYRQVSTGAARELEAAITAEARQNKIEQ